MGFTEENAKAALTRTRNDLSLAIDLIMDDQLINPEARNEDFRMNRNNSNILTNITTRNIQASTENANADNYNTKIITNDGNNNSSNNNNNNNFANGNIFLGNNIENAFNNRSPIIGDFGINDYNINNNTRSIMVNRTNESNNANNNSSSNNRSVRFNLDLENNDSVSSGLQDLMDPFEIDHPIAPSLNNIRERSRMYRGNRHLEMLTSRSILQPRERELYPRFDREELGRIINPLEFVSQVIRRDGYFNNANNNTNITTNNDLIGTNSTNNNNISSRVNSNINNNHSNLLETPDTIYGDINLNANNNNDNNTNKNNLNLGKNISSGTTNPTLPLVPLMRELDIFRFDNVSREAISSINDRNDVVNNRNNDNNNNTSSNLNLIDKFATPTNTGGPKLNETLSSDNSPSNNINNISFTNNVNLNANANSNISKAAEKSSGSIFKITTDNSKNNNINNNTNSTITNANPRNIFTITNTSTQNNISNNNIIRDNNNINNNNNDNTDNISNNANQDNHSIGIKRSFKSKIPSLKRKNYTSNSQNISNINNNNYNNLNTTINSNNNNNIITNANNSSSIQINTNILSASSENTNIPTRDFNVRNSTAALALSNSELFQTTNSNSLAANSLRNNNTATNTNGVTQNNTLNLNNNNSNNITNLNSNSLLETNRNNIQRIPILYDPSESRYDFSEGVRTSVIRRFIRSRNNNNNRSSINTERIDRSATEANNSELIINENQSESNVSLRNVNETSIANSNVNANNNNNTESRISLNVIENPLSSGYFNNSNRNPLSRFNRSLAETTTEIIPRSENPRSNIFSSRINDRFRINSDRRHFANLIFGGVRSGDESSSEDDNDFPSSIYNSILFYTVFLKRICIFFLLKVKKFFY